MPQDLAPKKYSPEEVRAILGRAMKADVTGAAVVSSAELRETAAELGVSQEALDVAMAEHEVVTALEAARAEYVGIRRQSLARQFVSWLAVNGGLTALDFFRNHEVTWSVWPAAIWGVVVLSSMASTFFMTSQDIDKGAHKLLEEKTKRAQRLLRTHRS